MVADAGPKFYAGSHPAGSKLIHTAVTRGKKAGDHHRAAQSIGNGGKEQEIQQKSHEIIRQDSRERIKGSIDGENAHYRFKLFAG